MRNVVFLACFLLGSVAFSCGSKPQESQIASEKLIEKEVQVSDSLNSILDQTEKEIDNASADLDNALKDLDIE